MCTNSNCKHCNEPERRQWQPGLVCQICDCFVHLNCLIRQGTPGEFAGDVFFDFTCSECSKDKTEIFKRNKFPWVNVVYLTLHHLQIHSQGISNNGFFHYKTHVCSFIDRHWDLLFGPKFKQKKNWIGTIAGVLSIYNNVLFQSGSGILYESGWWRLQHSFTPAVAAHILQELSREGKGGMKAKLKSNVSMDQTMFLEKVVEMGYKELIIDTDLKAEPERPPAKKRRADSQYDETSGISSNYFEADTTNNIDYAMQGSTSAASTAVYSDVEASFRGFDYHPPRLSECSSPRSHQYSFANYDSDSRSRSPYQQQMEPPAENEEKPEIKKLEAKPKKTVEEAKPIKRESLFSTELNSVNMPWLPEREIEPQKELVEMSPYEEIQLLKQVDALIPNVQDATKKAYLRRFRVKLALRRLKRHKHLAIFDAEKAAKLLSGFTTEDSKVMANAERVLDRFQRSYLLDNLSGTIASTNYGTVLLSRLDTTMFQSPYSGAALKPFIRRDMESRPLWLRLTEELLVKANRKNKEFVLPCRASIDYSYVRPHHMAAVNSLCGQYFWPGIDLTAALQYPEHSCVVTYKKLLVGCAFLVPDVRHNEAYISFVVTRPEWRRAGIATFMLYHLLQTCTGNDVTLHCSPTNPAIFLYQKFGFKVEEMIQDFYEKYYDIEYKGCRHALFLRLAR